MIKYLFLCLSFFTFFVSFVQNGMVKSATNVKRQSSTTTKSNVRAASVSSKRASTNSSSKSSCKTTTKTTSTSTSTKKTTSSSKTSSSASSVNSELKCLQGKLSGILDGACSFVLNEDIREVLGNEDLYCVYNYRDVGKTLSVYNYYLGAYYGITESSVKANTSIVNVKNTAKNALKYYQYLIDELNAGTLKESKVLDSVTSAVLANANMDFSVSNTIESKSIESVPISIDVIAGDIASCTKLTKAALTECNAVGNTDVKSKITESCTAYNSALIKLAGDKKAEALGYDAEIIAVLKQRVNADFYDYKDMVLLEQEKVELQETYSNVLNKKTLLENKNSRADIASKVNKLIEEVASTNSEELKKDKEASIALYKKQLCNLDKAILKADKDYEPDDDLTADCISSSNTATTSTTSTTTTTSSTDSSNYDDKKNSDSSSSGTTVSTTK